MINHLLMSALRSTNKAPRYAYIAPTFKQAKSIAWDYMKQYTSLIPGVKFNETELRCDLPNGFDGEKYRREHPRQYHYDFEMKEEYIDGLRVSPNNNFC